VHYEIRLCTTKYECVLRRTTVHYEVRLCTTKYECVLRSTTVCSEVRMGTTKYDCVLRSTTVYYFYYYSNAGDWKQWSVGGKAPHDHVAKKIVPRGTGEVHFARGKVRMGNSKFTACYEYGRDASEVVLVVTNV
jgi:hypothetical protein